MKAYEIKNLSDAEINQKIEETSEELFNLRFQLAIGQVSDTNRIAALKRDVARMKTVLRQRQLAAQ
ncbi:MAG: 50S ribosomal protein L29 [Anaerolineae bacterium]|nr:50S ribosomal protein L29 [Anaerolineae bacterium]